MVAPYHSSVSTEIWKCSLVSVNIYDSCNVILLFRSRRISLVVHAQNLLNVAVDVSTNITNDSRGGLVFLFFWTRSRLFSVEDRSQSKMIRISVLYLYIVDVFQSERSLPNRLEPKLYPFWTVGESKNFKSHGSEIFDSPQGKFWAAYVRVLIQGSGIFS